MFVCDINGINVHYGGMFLSSKYMAITREVCVAVGCFGSYMHQCQIYMAIKNDGGVMYVYIYSVATTFTQ